VKLRNDKKTPLIGSHQDLDASPRMENEKKISIEEKENAV